MAQVRQWAAIDKLEKSIQQSSARLARELADDGAVIARLALHQAYTEEGERRVERGEGVSEGRIKTGRMRNMLRSLKPKVTDGGVEAGVGWQFANKYFKFQERGTGQYRTDPGAYDPNFKYKYSRYSFRGGRRGGIVGAHSLWTARSWMEKNVEKYKRDFTKRIKDGMK